MGIKMNLVVTCDHCGKSSVYPFGTPDIISHSLVEIRDPYGADHIEISAKKQVYDMDALEIPAHISYGGEDYFLCKDCYPEYARIKNKENEIIYALKDCANRKFNATQTFNSLMECFFFDKGEEQPPLDNGED